MVIVIKIKLKKRVHTMNHLKWNILNVNMLINENHEYLLISYDLY